MLGFFQHKFGQISFWAQTEANSAAIHFSSKTGEKQAVTVVHFPSTVCHMHLVYLNTFFTTSKIVATGCSKSMQSQSNLNLQIKMLLINSFYLLQKHVSYAGLNLSSSKQHALGKVYLYVFIWSVEGVGPKISKMFGLMIAIIFVWQLEQHHSIN